jgi:hypothetical protein
MDFINANKKDKDEWAPYDNRSEDSEEADDHFKDSHWSRQKPKKMETDDDDDEDEQHSLSSKEGKHSAAKKRHHHEENAKESEIDKPKNYKGNDIDEIDENMFYLAQKGHKSSHSKPFDQKSLTQVDSNNLNVMG